MKKITLALLLSAALFSNASADCWTAFYPTPTSILGKHTEIINGVPSHEVYFLNNTTVVILFDLSNPGIQCISKTLTEVYTHGKKISYIQNANRYSRQASWIPLNTTSFSCGYSTEVFMTCYDVYANDKVLVRTK